MAVTTELSDFKIGMARANFARSGLDAYISLVHDDAGRVLERSTAGSVLTPSVPNIQVGGRISTACSAPVDC